MLRLIGKLPMGGSHEFLNELVYGCIGRRELKVFGEIIASDAYEKRRTDEISKVISIAEPSGCSVVREIDAVPGLVSRGKSAGEELRGGAMRRRPAGFNDCELRGGEALRSFILPEGICSCCDFGEAICETARR
nr:hypothetical protein Iba_chr11fCG3360 [Ipomoea batatas]